MKFHYEGVDQNGSPARGTLTADSPAQAGELLLQRGIFASEIHALDEPARSGRSLGSGRRLESVAVFLRQLAILVSTGTPLLEAIASLEAQTKDEKFRSVLATVRRRVEDGGSFSDAIAAHPRYFDGVCRSLIAAGETSGRLDAMLHRLSLLLRQQLKARRVVAGAMVYPMLLSTVAISVLITMVCFVLPRFEGLFKTLDTPLPPSTRVLMDLSNSIREYWWGAILAVAGAIGGGWVLAHSRAGAELIRHTLLRAPMFGRAVRSLKTARIARLMSVLLEAKVPLVETLALVRQSVAHPDYASLIERAEQAVTRGENVSQVFAQSDLITPSVCDAIRSAERTGQVAPVLGTLADYLDEDNEVLVKTITGLIEPAILIAMGIGVGFVAVSMFLPLFDLTAAGGGGA